MSGYVFVIQGDLTDLSADALAYSSSTSFHGSGHLYSAFVEHVPGFAEWFRGLRTDPGRCHVGDTFWLPLTSAVRPHGVVVVGAAGRRGVPGDDPARVAVRAAVACAVERLRAAGRSGRLLVALPTFRVGMAGDRYAALDSARVQVRAAHEAVLEHPDVDVAFVTYTPALYHTFLTARREVLPADYPDAGPAYPELEGALGAGECVLFVGAGLSCGAGMPDWGELIRRLALDLRIPMSDRLDYLDVAQWYRERFGRARLGELLVRTYGNRFAARPTLAHYLLLALPLRYVITTNYDDLLERALTALKQYPVRVACGADVARTGRGGGVYVVKFHGDAAEPDDTVLCRDDYDAFFQSRPAMAALLEGLLLNQTFFFVGYGLRDPNFRQIFSRIALMLQGARRPAFATTFEAADGVGDHLARQWQAKRLTLIPVAGKTAAEQDLQFLRFLDRLAERVTLRAPRLFLAPDAQASPLLEPLQRLLAGSAGEELVAALGHHHLAAPDARHLVAVLDFLARNGWRPRNGLQLCELWERAAEHLHALPEKRHLLIEALGYAERFADVERIRRQLESLDRAESAGG